MLGHAGLVSRNPQAPFSSVAMALPKGALSWLVADYRAVTQQAESVPWPQPDLEQASLFFVSAKCFTTLELLQVFWQMPMGGESKEAFTMATQKGLFSPRRFLQGVLNTTPQFQSVMNTEVHAGLAGVICKVWVDDTVIWPKTSERP